MKCLRAIPALLLPFLNACGGGGGSATPAAHTAGTAQTQSGSLSIAIPLQSGTASMRRSQFVSPNAAQAVVAVNGTQVGSAFDVSAGSPACTTSGGGRTCSLTFSAPVGNNQSVAVELLTNGTPPVMLGEGSNSVDVVAGTPFTVAVGINPMVAGIASFSFSGGGFTYGTPATLTGTITFKDPSGAPITGSGNVPNFLIPVTLQSSDSHITFSTPGLTTPGQTFTATYDGSQAVASSVQLSLMAGSTTLGSQAVTLPGLFANRINTGPVGSGPTTFPFQIVVGPDNKIWWTEQLSHNVQRVDPAVGAASLATFATGLGSGPIGIASGGDGNIWYSSGLNIYRRTTSNLGVPGSGPAQVSVGSGSIGQLGTDSQGNVWFINGSTNDVGYVDSSFTVHSYPIPTTGATGANTRITLGPDDAMYFAEVNATAWKIARVATPATGGTGTVTETSIPNTSISLFPLDLAAGPDGNMWVAVYGNNADNQFVARFPPSSGALAFTEYANIVDPNAFANFVTMAKGPDGNMWIAEGGGALKIPPANPSAALAEFFTDDGQTTMEQCIAGPDGNMWCTVYGSAALGQGFIPTADGVVSFRPR